MIISPEAVCRIRTLLVNQCVINAWAMLASIQRFPCTFSTLSLMPFYNIKIVYHYVFLLFSSKAMATSEDHALRKVTRFCCILHCTGIEDGGEKPHILQSRKLIFTFHIEDQLSNAVHPRVHPHVVATNTTNCPTIFLPPSLKP